MADKPERKKRIDPDVAELMSQDRKRQEERSLPTEVRQQRAEWRADAKARNRKMLDLPRWQTDLLAELAAEHSCPESQIAALLIARGLADLRQGSIDVDAYKTPSTSPKYDYNLEIPEGF